MDCGSDVIPVVFQSIKIIGNQRGESESDSMTGIPGIRTRLTGNRARLLDIKTRMSGSTD